MLIVGNNGLGKLLLLIPSYRYAINDAAVDWSSAEAQIEKSGSGGTKGRSTVVSVKTGMEGGKASEKKRKAVDSAVRDGDNGGGSVNKKSRRSLKKVKR
jgi:N-acetyltransferase 10